MEVRAEVSANSRTEELYDKWVETVEGLYPNDKPRRDLLIARFLREQHEEKLILQKADQEQKEEKQRKRRKVGSPGTKIGNLAKTLTSSRHIFCVPLSRKMISVMFTRGPILEFPSLAKTRNLMIGENGSYLRKPPRRGCRCKVCPQVPS